MLIQNSDPAGPVEQAIRRRRRRAPRRIGRPVPTLLAGAAFAVALILSPAATLAQPTATHPDHSGHGPHSDERGTTLVWSRFVDLEFSAARIVVGRPGGGAVRELTASVNEVQDIDPKLSPDGSRVLFERDLPNGSTRIVVVAVDGSHQHVLPLGCVDPCAADVSPTWGPDGRHVYFTRVVGPFDQVNDSAASAVLWRARLDGRGLRRISSTGIDGAYEDYLATFAPAGYVVFLRLRNADVKSAAFRRDPSGRTTQLTPYSLDADELSVSPASRGPSRNLVVFETFGHGAPDGVAQAVATVPATCGRLRQCSHRVRYLTSPESLPESSFNPAWAPDGRQIAFVRFSFVDPGPAIGDIWRMSWSGRHQRPVSTSPLFEFRPSWGRASAARATRP